MHDDDAGAGPGAPAPPPAMGLGMAAVVTVGVVLVIVGFVVLGAAFGLVPLYAGFLVLWYFSSVDVLETGALPALFVGAVCGTLTAWLLQYGLAAWGPMGVVPGLMVIIAAIFVQLLGRLPLAINRAYMLYVTVLGAPLLQRSERFDRVLIVIVMATVYFGGIVWIGRKLAASRQAKAG